MSTEETIQEQINGNSILLYMKGNPEQPIADFSAGYTGFDGLRQTLRLC